MGWSWGYGEASCRAVMRLSQRLRPTCGARSQKSAENLKSEGVTAEPYFTFHVSPLTFRVASNRSPQFAIKNSFPVPLCGYRFRGLCIRRSVGLTR